MVSRPFSPNPLVLNCGHDVVPSPPRSLLHRLKFLEEHLIKLEKEYPPWAALHFNQPHRGVRSRFPFL